MPRNATGGYTLPAGNPVVTGTLISAGWANPTMADIQLALTDSLSRSGNGGMLAPFKVPDGSNINPSLSFVNEATSGIYRFGANDIRMAVGTTDRMRWQGAGTPPQIYDEVNDRWNDLGAGGVDWRHLPTLPAEVEQGVGYMTRGGQSTLMPASPITGQAVTFSDLDNDWSETNFLTLDGNGNTFTQGNQTTYDLDLKGAFAQFAYLDGQWQIVNFGRLSDAYGFDLDDYATLNLVNSKPNDNLLINGDRIINQREFAGGQPAANVYGKDRWKGSADGLQIEQVVENTETISQSVTISWQGGTGTASVNGVSDLNSGDNLILDTSGNYPVIVPTDASKIKLEYGEVATPYQARPIAEELALCERYYRLNPNLQGNISEINDDLFVCPDFSEGMRTTSAISLLSTASNAIHIASVGFYGVASIAQSNGFYISLNVDSAATTGASAQLRFGTLAADSEIY